MDAAGSADPDPAKLRRDIDRLLRASGVDGISRAASGQGPDAVAAANDLAPIARVALAGVVLAAGQPGMDLAVSVAPSRRSGAR